MNLLCGPFIFSSLFMRIHYVCADTVPQFIADGVPQFSDNLFIFCFLFFPFLRLDYLNSDIFDVLGVFSACS